MSSNKKAQEYDKRAKRNEKLFKLTLTSAAFLLILLFVGIAVTLTIKSLPSIKTFGIGFVFSSVWDPVINQFGALTFIVGTLITTFLALAISIPFSMSISLFLGEYFKKGILSELCTNAVELLAGIPSVVYGFVALYFLAPFIAKVETLFGLQGAGLGILTASIVVAIMIIPYSAAIIREVIRLAPKELKEAGLALGATRFELIRYIIIPYARSGIVAGNFLALGRAIGETMAVTMVIGNANKLPDNIFSPSNTMASVIANEFAEAIGELHLSSLIEIALVLLIITAIFNIIGKLYVKKLANK